MENKIRDSVTLNRFPQSIICEDNFIIVVKNRHKVYIPVCINYGRERNIF